MHSLTHAPTRAHTHTCTRTHVHSWCLQEAVLHRAARASCRGESRGDLGVGGTNGSNRRGTTAKIETLYSYLGGMLGGGKRRGRPQREASPAASSSSSSELSGEEEDEGALPPARSRRAGGSDSSMSGRPRTAAAGAQARGACAEDLATRVCISRHTHTHTHVVVLTRLCAPGAHQPRKVTRSSAAEATGSAHSVSRGRGRPRKDRTRAALDQRRSPRASRSPRARRLELTPSHLKEQSNARARVSRSLRFLDLLIFYFLFFLSGVSRSSRSLLTG